MGIFGQDRDPGRCNSAERGKDSTTAVGAYSPAGDSPYGCADMARNVWEWCQSLYRHYPYDPKDDRERLDDRGPRVLRGGSFYSSQWVVRCAFPGRDAPHDWNWHLGFRVVEAPVSSDL